MVEQSATIKNTQGIHCRPSAVIVKEVQHYQGTIGVHVDGMVCDPRSIMALLSLGLQAGQLIKISVEGDGEEACLSKLVDLFETEFDFPKEQKND